VERILREKQADLIVSRNGPVKNGLDPTKKPLCGWRRRVRPPIQLNRRCQQREGIASDAQEH
jgi:hypothetical protein